MNVIFKDKNRTAWTGVFNVTRFDYRFNDWTEIKDGERLTEKRPVVRLSTRDTWVDVIMKEESKAEMLVNLLARAGYNGWNSASIQLDRKDVVLVEG